MTMTVEIAPGPASIGMASGVSATSSLAVPSATSSRPSCVRRSPCSMSSATNQRMSPPAVRNAGRVMPSTENSAVPVAANAIRSSDIAMHARRAVLRRSAAVSACVITR